MRVQMADLGHPPLAAPRAGGRRPAERRSLRAGRVAAVVAWVAVAGGFVAYLASLDSFKDAYGSVGTGALLLVWITLFSILFHFTPRLRSPRGREAPSPPTAALRSPVAQSRMLSVMGPRATGLTAREREMVDWGFAFGIAWAVARRQDPAASEAVVSERALHAARALQHHAYRS